MNFLKKFAPNLWIHSCFAILVLFFAVSQLYLYSTLQDVKYSLERFELQDSRLELLTNLKQVVIDAETGQRGFILTNEKRYLLPLDSAKERLPDLKANIRKNFAKNDKYLGKYERLEGLIDLRFREIATSIKEYEIHGLELTIQKILTENLELSPTIRSIIDEMILDVKTDVKRASTSLDLKRKFTEDTLFYSTLFNILFFIGLYVFILRLWNTNNTERRETRFANDLSIKASITKNIEERSKVILDALYERVKFDLATVYIESDENFRLAYSLGANWELPEFIAKKSSLVQRYAAIDSAVAINNLQQHEDLTTKSKSSLTTIYPRHIAIIPLTSEGHTFGFIEIGRIHSEFNTIETDIFSRTRPTLSISMNSIVSELRMQDLLGDSRKKSETLDQQKTILMEVNETLTVKTQELQNAKSSLQSQQEELRQSNEELEQQASALEEQRALLKTRNSELLQIKQHLENRSHQLEKADRSKTEFLANMSHELRTPLNSILILAELMEKNKNKTLTAKEMEYAATIKNSGKDLLTLIDDILDLSKIEAGKIKIEYETTSVSTMTSNLNATFLPMAMNKGLDFKVEIAEDVPEYAKIDSLRICQILKNLISNAIKFTEKGSVVLSVKKQNDRQQGLLHFEVRDSGIGISEDNLKKIFAAFEQGDGTTSRKYGGTGLGLTISKKLALLMNGRITVKSEVGEGSVFSLMIPLQGSSEISLNVPEPIEELHEKVETSTPKSLDMEPLSEIDEIQYPDNLKPNNDLLIVEDDSTFSRHIFNEATNTGFNPLVVRNIHDAIAYLKNTKPAAILLDIRLPDGNGLLFLERMKQNENMFDIPIHVISAFDYQKHSLKLGAIGYLRKPADLSSIESMLKRIQNFVKSDHQKILVVEDNETQRMHIGKLFEEKKTEVIFAESGEAALELAKSEIIDCIILDLQLPDMDGIDFLSRINSIKEISMPPIVVYTAQELNQQEENELMKYTDSIVIKTSKSSDRLKKEVNMFLHSMKSKFPLKTINQFDAFSYDREFQGKTVLLVDDDTRNIFSLSAILEQIGFNVLYARDGLEAINAVKNEKSINVVLMDVMMPGMDGNEATRNIRRMGATYKDLPIIAVTAKAMKGDKEKCLQSGANDYLSKPIDIDKLISTLNIWVGE